VFENRVPRKTFDERRKDKQENGDSSIMRSVLNFALHQMLIM
jgi:hypothetical protein